jgi:D-aminopeptidase
LLWFRLALIWKSDPLNAMTLAEAGMPVLFMNSRDKIEIERLLSQLERVKVSARSEFELKSPVPDAAYSNIICRTRTIVDVFHSTNLILLNTPTPSEGQISLLRFTATIRQQLSERISHLLAGKSWKGQQKIQ